jgi:hypothetical protein
MQKVNAQPTWRTSLPQTALNSLTLNNKRNSEGSDESIVNPAYDDISDERISEEIESILSTVYLTDELRKIEDSNLSKFGPRSLAKPWSERKESLSDYYSHEDYDPGEFASTSGRLRPTSLSSVGANLLKSSSAGLPYMKKKGLVLDEALLNHESEEGEYPCVLYTRTQEQRKTRNVWGYPISDTIKEQKFFMPILKVERLFPHRAALVGPDAVDAALTNLLMSKSDSEIVVNVDFSSYDATISPKHSYQAFQNMCNLFQTEYHQEFYDVFRRFVTIGVFTPEGEWLGPHGVPSGSSFTNTVDSLVQFAASGKTHKCQVQGDDGIYVIARSDQDLLFEGFRTAGLVINEDKSTTFDTKEAIYLQRYYHPEYRSQNGGLGGVYSLYRAFARIKYLERWTDFKAMDLEGADFFALRTITILENCKHHPGFESAVKLALSFDKFKLVFSNQGLSAYSRAMESKSRAGVFNQYGLQKGINSFETVKLLKTL